MRLSELRLIKTDRDGEQKRYRLSVGQGVTFVFGQLDSAGGSPFSDLHLNLISDKSRVFRQPINFPELTPPQTSLINIGSLSGQRRRPGIFWDFVFSDGEREVSLSAEKTTKGQIDFFSQVIVGDEGGHLGNQLDLSLLADRHVSDESKRASLLDLRERLIRSQQALFDESTGLGQLVSVTADYERCQNELSALDRTILPNEQIVSLTEDDEKSITELKKQDDALAREQRLMTLLERKSEYETLLELRRELKEIEEREGRYGARITELGHDITVHELTALAQWRGNAVEVKRDILKLQNISQHRREEKATLEQERILLAHQMRRNQELKDSLLDEYEYLALKSDGEHEKLSHYSLPVEEKPKVRSFPSAFHYSLLASLFALSVGLLLISTAKTIGIVLVVLALLGLAVTFFPGMVKRLSRPKEKAVTAKQIDAEELRSRINDLDQCLRRDSDELNKLSKAIDELECDIAQYAIKIETAERQLNRLNNDLLSTIKRYAGPSEIHEIDDIIETLSKQRESSASHNEAIADLLRRIADLKHGRSDEDMVREYESVCEQLYGGSALDTTGVNSQQSHIKTLQLHYDPVRAKQISEERVEIARMIDEKTISLKEKRERLALSKESSITAASLRNRCKMLGHSITEMENDLSKLCKSIAWINQVLISWHEKDDLQSVMAKTVRYLGRMSGRRMGKTLPIMPIDPPEQKIRVPGFLEHTVSPYVAPVSIDPAIFQQTTAEQNYLAFRLAWATQSLMTLPEDSPLIFLSPAIPPEFSQVEELVNALEEWTLETGRQVIFFTTDSYIADIAMNRDMVVYQVG